MAKRFLTSEEMAKQVGVTETTICYQSMILADLIPCEMTGFKRYYPSESVELFRQINKYHRERKTYIEIAKLLIRNVFEEQQMDPKKVQNYFSNQTENDKGKNTQPQDRTASLLLTSKKRVFMYLQEICEDKPKAIPIKQIATDLNLSKTTISRILKELEKEGLIERKVNFEESSRGGKIQTASTIIIRQAS